MTRWQPSPSLVISFLALFVALSGTALALRANSVRSKQIRDGGVKLIDVHGDAIDSSKVVDESLGEADLDGGSVGSSEIATDAVGSSEILMDAVGASEIGSGAVGAAEIATGVVGSNEIGDGGIDAAEIGDGITARSGTAEVAPANTESNGSYEVVTSSVACAAGEEIIAAHGTWVGVDPAIDNEELMISEIQINDSGESATVSGGNDTDLDNTFRAVAMCLEV